MSENDQSGPTWRDFEQLVKAITQVVRANTNALSIIAPQQLQTIRLVDEAKHLVSLLRDSSPALAERLAAKADAILDATRSLRDLTRDALVESRATNDRLGITREEIGELRVELADHTRRTGLTPPQGTPVPHAEELQEGLVIRDGKVQATVGSGSLWRGAKRAVPWLGPPIGAAVWHFVQRLLGH